MNQLFAICSIVFTLCANAQDTHIPGNLYVGGGGAFTGSVTAANFTNAGLTATRVPFAGAGGLLIDNAAMTFTTATGELAATKFLGALNGTVGATTPAAGTFSSVTDSGLTATRVPFASAAGLLTDNAALTFTSGTGTLAATVFSGALTGNVTGNVSGSAATVTAAAQPAITSVGTLTSVTSSGAISGTTGSFSGNTLSLGNGTSVGAAPTFTLNAGGGASPFIEFQQTGVAKSDIQYINSGVLQLSVGAGAANINAAGLSVTGNYSLSNNLLISSTSPTIASGFCATPAITANNTFGFRVTPGGSCAGSSSGSITLPTAPNGWACNAQYLQAPGVQQVMQTATSPTSASFGNYTLATGALTNLSTGVAILFNCAAF